MTIDEILADCLSAIQEQGRSVEECLARYPAHRAELEPLLRLAVLLEQARSVVAPSAYRQVAPARMRNLVAAHPQGGGSSSAPVKGSVWQGWRGLFNLGRRPALSALVPLLLVALVLLGGSGTLVASANALPNEPLYSVKTTLESVRLAGSQGEAADAELLLAFAAERLDEVSRLMERNQPDAAQIALTRYAAQVGAALSLTEQTGEGEYQALAARLDEDLARNEERLAALLDQVPEEAQPALNRALEASRQRPDGPRQNPNRDEGQPGLADETPEATETPEPTETVQATETVGATETAEATETREPTETAEATRTPRATHTPRPTHTVRPTHTPRPTNTARPTDVPPGPPATPPGNGNPPENPGNGNGPPFTPPGPPPEVPPAQPTRQPTNTPRPTNTRVPPTRTPVSPTETSQPTETSEPTETPEPTRTPGPPHEPPGPPATPPGNGNPPENPGPPATPPGNGNPPENPGPPATPPGNGNPPDNPGPPSDPPEPPSTPPGPPHEPPGPPRGRP